MILLKNFKSFFKKHNLLSINNENQFQKELQICYKISTVYQFIRDWIFYDPFQNPL